MGHELNVPADIAVLDAAGLAIFPVLWMRTPISAWYGYGIGYEGCDYNEMNDIWTARSCVPLTASTLAIPPSPMHGKQALPARAPGGSERAGRYLYRHQDGGRACGQHHRQESVAMKCAFGENPKRCYKDKRDFTRMSTAAFLRGRWLPPGITAPKRLPPTAMYQRKCPLITRSWKPYAAGA